MRLFLALFFVASSSFGDMSIEPSTNVIVDGINAGKLCDVVINYKSRRDEIQAAVEASLMEKCEEPLLCKKLLDNARKCKLTISDEVAKVVEDAFAKCQQEEADAKAKADAIATERKTKERDAAWAMPDIQ